MICVVFISQLTELDKQERGTLPAHAFTLMTLYFLQHVQPPVLPVVHEMSDSLKKRGESFTEKNAKSLTSADYDKFFHEASQKVREKRILNQTHMIIMQSIPPEFLIYV